MKLKFCHLVTLLKGICCYVNHFNKYRLANKQDKQGAMDEIDLVEKMNLEKLVNDMRCPTFVELCSILPQENGRKRIIDPRLQNGYE